MKQFIFTGVLVLAGVVAGEAMAATCDGSAPYTTPVTTVAALTTLFSGNTICATATVSGEVWHEYHNPTGSVLEKIGNGTPTGVDPNVPIGTWASVADGPPDHFRYSYTGDGTYDYTVYTDGGTGVELCGLIRATGIMSPGKVTTAC